MTYPSGNLLRAGLRGRSLGLRDVTFGAPGHGSGYGTASDTPVDSFLRAGSECLDGIGHWFAVMLARS
jgi:hypothetical protein